MNTIKIRKKYPELIERIRSNVRAYKDFTQDTTDNDSGRALYGLVDDNNYYDFLMSCYEDDIKELNALMEIENE